MTTAETPVPPTVGPATAGLSYAGDEIPRGSATIEVNVAELSQLFNSMDPSPFRDKDLDDDAEEFIVGWGRELPADKPLALFVHLDKPSVTEEMGATLRNALRGYFAGRAEVATRRLHAMFRLGRTSLLIGLVFLVVCLLIGDAVARLRPDSRVAEIVHEGLLIIGWVAMWRPLEIFLYDWWPIRNDRKLYERLSRMAVRIVCRGTHALEPANQA